MRKIVLASAATVVALGTLGCGPTREEVTQLLEQQGEILERIAKLEENQEKALEARPAARRRPPEDFDRVYQIEIGDSPVRGNPDAPITIVEFSDFQCPFCARSAPVLKEVQERYGDKVRIVYKHFPLDFHKAARPAAIASVAAQEQGKFWEMHDVLFANTSALQAGQMEAYAEKAGLDVERFRADYQSKRAEYDQRVGKEYQEGVKARVRGTPTLYINGKKVRDRSVDGMSAMIDEALKGAGS
jgi:protein-disulfide isomerase